MRIQELSDEDLRRFGAWRAAGARADELDDHLQGVKAAIDRQMRAADCGTVRNPHFWATINEKLICIKCGATI